MDDRSTVYVGVALLDLHLPESRSLKQRRASVRPLIERLRNRHRVLVIEAGHAELHQRATLAICAISTDAGEIEQRFQRVRTTVDDSWPGFVLSWDVDVTPL